MKRKIISAFIISCISLMFFSCATTVNVKLTRPSKLDLNGAKTIAVLPIKPCAYYREYNTSLGMEILVNTFYQIFEIRDPDEQLAIDSLRTQIERGLMDSPYITLVSSEKSADVYFTGEVSYFSVHDDSHEEKKLIKAAQGNQKAEYAIKRYWRREVTFILRYQIVDSSNNRVIGFDEIRCNSHSDSYEKKNALPSAYSIIKSDINAAARNILMELQPYMVTKSITLLESKTKDKALKERMKAADNLAKDKEFQLASEAFTLIYEETGHLEAGYNAAILQEALGNLSKAEEMMMEVYNIHPDKRVAKGLSDIRYEISQAERLNSQINSDK